MNVFEEQRLLEICRAYPMINPGEVEAFATVYYPLAIIEAGLSERCIEEFETVPHTVLRLIALSHVSPESIARLLGLGENYVEKVISLLISDGHVGPDGITELGRESLAAGKKITEVTQRQRFQLDALNLRVVRIDQTVEERYTLEKTYLKQVHTVLDYCAEVDEDSIKSTIESNAYEALMAQKKQVLHTNVTAVTDVCCVEVRYAKARLLKLKNRAPVIFCKRFDFTERFAAQYPWLPFAVDSVETAKWLGLDGCGVYTDAARDFISTAEKLFAEKLGAVRGELTADKITELLGKRYCLNKGLVSVSPSQGLIRLESGAVTRADEAAFALLCELGRRGFMPICDEESGLVLRIYSEDESLMTVARDIASAAEKHGYALVRKGVIERLLQSDLSGRDVVGAFASAVARYR